MRLTLCTILGGTIHTGKYCGHSLLLSFPFVPSEASLIALGYEGNFKLLQSTNASEWLDEDGSTEKSHSKRIDEQTLNALRPLLPPSDPFKASK